MSNPEARPPETLPREVTLHPYLDPRPSLLKRLWINICWFLFWRG